MKTFPKPLTAREEREYLERYKEGDEEARSISVSYTHLDVYKRQPYSMALREDINTGYYPIKFNIRYREDSTADLSEPIEEIFYVRVQGKDEDELAADANENERTKARIIVDGYETIPETVYAGQAFTLKAVSYTHLDVYKRQGQMVAAAMPKGCR